jgi:hypothetical protein
VPVDTSQRVSIDGKATVHLGEVSRGGLTRGDHKACAHALGLKETYIPCGIVDEDTGQVRLTLGRSYKPSDFIVDALEAWWAALDVLAQGSLTRLPSKRENGPESSGRRTPFLQRMVTFCEAIGKPMQLRYDPPYHSKSNPMERCGGILALHWNGTKWVHVETMLEWAKTMTWKGRHPIVALRQRVDQKGSTLRQQAMRAVEDRLERHPELPCWDILIQPASTR